MEFGKFYKVTENLNKLIENKEVYSYTKDYCKDLFICEDTHDFWVCRILKNMNEEYEEEEDIYLLERNKINKYDFLNFMDRDNEDKIDCNINKKTLELFISCLGTTEIINSIIKLDDEGLENWDAKEYYDYDEIIEDIDGGFGIIDINKKEVV